MLPQPPDTLRAIRPFIHRGNQMASRDPIITYYCYFYAVRYALSKGLHTVSPESTSYVSSVMEELESRKEALRGDDRIDDDMVARAYVENFAGRIFDNGSRAVTAGTATEKTPDTLQAAATFLEITKIWEEEQEGGDGREEDGELAKKIRYAKWHAARILKAIKEGADINPPPPPVDQETRPPPATVEEVPDEGEPPQNEYFPAAPPPPAAAAAPSVPEIHEPSPPTLAPSSMGAANTAFPDMAFEHTHLPPPPSSPPAAATFHPQPSAPTPATAAFPPPQQPPFPPPQPSAYHSPPATSFHSPPPPPPQQQHYPPPQQQHQQHQHYQPIEVSEENIGKAQKSAKWAISALDYDDVETAVKQLKQALALLGAAQ
jgi:vacuolar protein sorting-associated protein VTA1